jgi:hypothetical protein
LRRCVLKVTNGNLCTHDTLGCFVLPVLVTACICAGNHLAFKTC